MNELTEREREVARLILAGNGTTDTATTLGISVSRASTTKNSVLAKVPLFAVAFELAGQLYRAG